MTGPIRQSRAASEVDRLDLLRQQSGYYEFPSTDEYTLSLGS